MGSSAKCNCFLPLTSFQDHNLLMVFYWRLSDQKTHQVSRILLSILAYLNWSLDGFDSSTNFPFLEASFEAFGDRFKCTNYIWYHRYLVHSIRFQTFFIQAFKNSLCYCYTSYEMTDQFLWFQVQMNSYRSNWNTQLVNFKNAIWTAPRPPYSPDLTPYDFWLILKLSLWDNWGDERGCDEDHWPAHTRGLPWDLAEVVGTVKQAHCSRRRLLRRGLEFHMCTINKSAHTKKV